LLKKARPATVDWCAIFRSEASSDIKSEALELLQEAIQMNLEDLRLGGKPVPESASINMLFEIGVAA
jgi:hypothetical protein